jgi:D-alanyl-lipoteichoic acid acyltransferase DltB (MBOAT superfamily)
VPALSSLGIKGLTINIEVFAPVGISFYTFRVISHLIDVYRVKLAVPDPVSYAAYITFFPQVLSGPISRAQDFYENLRHPQKIKYSDTYIFTLILSGLIKKLVIASFLYDFTQNAFATPQAFSSLDLIISALAYACMIFTDFSGYSDIANALAILLGFNVSANFNSPYKAIGLKDFWNRWHISLSTWLKDYVYIPLGGSRGGKLRKYLNILITMLVSGLWHGAGVTYIIWGLWHGIGSVTTHILSDIFNKKPEVKMYHGRQVEQEVALTGFGRVLAWFVTFSFVCVGWIFFNSRTPENAMLYIGGMFSSSVSENTLVNYKLFAVIAVVIYFNFIGQKAARGFRDLLYSLQGWLKYLIMIILIYVVIKLGPDLVPPFIYFSF